MIKLLIIGSLGKDAEQKEVGGKSVINFSVAHSEKWKNAQGEQMSKTTWVECGYWTDKVGILPYLKKGQLVYVEGQPEANAYTNKENTAVGTLRLKVGSIQLLGGSKEESAQQQSAVPPQVTNMPIDDDVPF